MMLRRIGLSEFPGTAGMGVVPRLDWQLGAGSGRTVFLGGRSLISPKPTHEEVHMDALKRWLKGEDEAFEEWLAD